LRPGEIVSEFHRASLRQRQTSSQVIEIGQVFRLVVLGRMVRITGKPLEIAVAFYNSVKKINGEKVFL
ncbi:MAG: hypothetical protein V3U20_09535, partial [Thermoplasmata archaeon]